MADSSLQRRVKEAFRDLIPQQEREVLDTGMNHPRECRCDTCKRWWKLMTTREDDDFGPFTREEIHGK